MPKNKYSGQVKPIRKTLFKTIARGIKPIAIGIQTVTIGK